MKELARARWVFEQQKKIRMEGVMLQGLQMQADGHDLIPWSAPRENWGVAETGEP